MLSWLVLAPELWHWVQRFCVQLAEATARLVSDVLLWQPVLPAPPLVHEITPALVDA